MKRRGRYLAPKKTKRPVPLMGTAYRNIWAEIRVTKDFDKNSSTGGAQEALNDLPTTGGVLYISEGAVSSSATIQRAINNVVVMGAGLASKISYDGSTAVFDVGAQTGWVFINVVTDAGGIDISSAPDAVLIASGPDGTRNYFGSDVRLRSENKDNTKELLWEGIKAWPFPGIRMYKDPTAGGTYCEIDPRPDTAEANPVCTVRLFRRVTMPGGGSEGLYFTIFKGDGTDTKMFQVDAQLGRVIRQNEEMCHDATGDPKSRWRDDSVAAGNTLTVVTDSYIHHIEAHFKDTDTPADLGHVIYTGIRPGANVDLYPTTAANALWVAAPVNADDPYIRISSTGTISIGNDVAGAQAIRCLSKIFYSKAA